VPIRMQVPGTDRWMMTHRLMAFTGGRFVNAHSLRALGQPFASSLCVENRDQNAGKGKRKRRCAEAAASTFVKSSRLQQLNDDAAALLVDVMTSNAPSELSISQILELVAAAEYCMAGCVIDGLSSFLAPMLASAPCQEVRDNRKLVQLP
jgi:hypothetical protein